MIVIQTLVLILVTISRPDNMQLHELIVTQILQFVKPGLNGWLKGSYAPVSAEFCQGLFRFWSRFGKL